MPSQAQSVPAESDLLCENCGYTLTGLPETGNCPECGEAIAKSLANNRRPAAWDDQKQFFSTTWQIMFHPTRFFSTTTSRSPIRPAMRFATIHMSIASVLFAASCYLHVQWYQQLGGQHVPLILGVVLILPIFAALAWTTALAAKLTAWEARYRGLRMPVIAIRRALYYHSAHYLPPALLVLGTIVGYRVLLLYQPSAILLDQKYLYSLCGEIILSAAYLFQTYWIAMRSIRYANA